MADAYKTLYQGQVPGTATTLATVGALKSWIIKHWTAANPTAGALTLKLWKNGTTDPFLLYPPITIPAGGVAEWDGTMAMATTEFIAGLASAATSITLTIDGDEVS